MKRKHVIISSLLIVMMLFLLPACGARTEKNSADAGKNDMVVSDKADNMDPASTDNTLKDDAGNIANGIGEAAGGAAQGAKDIVNDLTDGVQEGARDLNKVAAPDRPAGTQ